MPEMRAGDEATSTPFSMPWWRWLVYLIGWPCLVIMFMSPILLKDSSDFMALILLVASCISVGGALLYVVGRRTFWVSYPKAELRFMFWPFILGAAIVFAIIISVVLAALFIKGYLS
jgi:hypothetical protein